MPDTSGRDVRQEILDIKHLPPLSVTASRLLETVANPEVEISEISYIISQDPGLMARIIGLANAAYFGQTIPITTVHDAIVRVLGLNMVRSLALSISVSGAFKVDGCIGFSAKEYWFNAIGCATLSRMMALRIPAGERPDPEQVYLSGLLHNLGCLVLAHLFPVKLSHVYKIMHQDPDSDLQMLQQEHLGVDWVSAGEWLVKRWHLPEFVAEVMGAVADRSYTSEDRCDVTLIRGAIQWLNGFPGMESGVPRLRDEFVSGSISGLGVDSLDLIEDKFLGHCEELKALASSL
ncbi:MAG: HDOD domain-containing protein [Gammaproteobacteria bacterium]|nr:HDOD domain-containing protein [Gammaproteobacteria bacterium]